MKRLQKHSTGQFNVIGSSPERTDPCYMSKSRWKRFILNILENILILKNQPWKSSGIWYSKTRSNLQSTIWRRIWRSVSIQNIDLLHFVNMVTKSIQSNIGNNERKIFTVHLKSRVHITLNTVAFCRWNVPLYIRTIKLLLLSDFW